MRKNKKSYWSNEFSAQLDAETMKEFDSLRTKRQLC